MIFSGCSQRGLSEVTTATSANRETMRPICGRFSRSRSPPQPNTATTRPSAKPRTAVSTFSSASGVWA